MKRNKKDEKNRKKTERVEAKSRQEMIPVEKEQVKKSDTKLSKRKATQHQRNEMMRAMRNIGNDFYLHCTVSSLHVHLLILVSCLKLNNTKIKLNKSSHFFHSFLITFN